MANEKMLTVEPRKMTLSEVLSLTGNKEQSKWGKISAAAGTIESVLAAGKQLKTEEIVNTVLTVDRLEFREAVDDTTGSRNTFPIMTFSEYPGCYYNAGTLLQKNVEAWAASAGDNPEEDKTLPNLNEEFEQEGGPQIIIYKKEGKRYYSVYVM